MIQQSFKKIVWEENAGLPDSISSLFIYTPPAGITSENYKMWIYCKRKYMYA